jgi:hypothetical protein
MMMLLKKYQRQHARLLWDEVANKILPFVWTMQIGEHATTGITNGFCKYCVGNILNEIVWRVGLEIFIIFNICTT